MQYEFNLNINANKELFFPSDVINRPSVKKGATVHHAFEWSKIEVKDRLAKHEPV